MPGSKAPGTVERLIVADGYFFLRAIRPVAREPRPNNPNKGSGEAVCGSLETFFSVCSRSEALCALWFWSLLEVPAALVLLEEDGFCELAAPL